jgi:transcription elongation GreA/GreB family factor
MALSDHLSQLVEDGDFDAVEDAWLEHMSAQPDDVSYFAATAQALDDADQEERSRFLLQLLAEHLQEAELWEAQLDLLRLDASSGLEPSRLHAQILDTLRRIYADSPSLEGLMEEVGLHRATEDIPKTWQKVSNLRSLLQFEVGTVVWMEGKGAGRVVEVNLELDNFKVDFEHHPGLRVGFRAAAKLLHALPETHILRRKLENPAELEELRKTNPGELLLVLLQSYDRPRTAAAIRRILNGIVGEEEWNSWWAAARKHPQILPSTAGGRQRYGWAASDSDALRSVRNDFTAADIPQKLEIFRKNNQRSAELRAEMVEQLRELAAARRHSDPSAALTIWLTLDRLGTDLQGWDWSPAAVFEDSSDPAKILAGIEERSLRESAYRMLREHHSESALIFNTVLPQEEDPRLLSQLAGEIEAQRPDLLRSFVDDVLSQPRKRPAAFVWMTESMDVTALVTNRSPLRLLQQILAALQQPEFAPYRARLLKLFDSEGVVLHLLPHLSEDQARQAENSIGRAALEAYVRSALVNAVHLRFPTLRKTPEVPLYATSASIEARRLALKKLLEEDLPANRRAIEEARALGDLSENFEYKSARQRHEYLTARAETLKHDLQRVRVFDPTANDASEVRIGCRLELRTSGGASRHLTILGPWESEPDHGVISYDSDLGQSLLGLEQGDRVLVDGEEHEVASIEAWSRDP